MKTPLFLQMEMQVWARTSNGTKINGHIVPLKNNIFTSISKLVQSINEDRNFPEKIDRIILHKDFKVNLKFNFLIVDEDPEIITLDEPTCGLAEGECENFDQTLPQMPGDYTGELEISNPFILTPK